MTECPSSGERSVAETGWDTAGNRNRGGERWQANNCLKHLFILSNGQPTVPHYLRKIALTSRRGKRQATRTALKVTFLPLLTPKKTMPRFDAGI